MLVFGDCLLSFKLCCFWTFWILYYEILDTLRNKNTYKNKFYTSIATSFILVKNENHKMFSIMIRNDKHGIFM